MYLLGISAYYHDSAAALLQDGAIVATAQEERFPRKKYDARFPINVIEYCLSEAGVTLGDAESIIFYDKPLVMKIGAVLGWLNTQIILGLIFFLVFVPYSFVLRLLKKKPLSCKLETSKETYRLKVENQNVQVSRIHFKRLN